MCVCANQKTTLYAKITTLLVHTGRSFALMKSIREIDVIYLLIDAWIETNSVHYKLPKSMQDSQLLPIA